MLRSRTEHDVRLCQKCGQEGQALSSQEHTPHESPPTTSPQEIQQDTEKTVFLPHRRCEKTHGPKPENPPAILTQLCPKCTWSQGGAKAHRLRLGTGPKEGLPQEGGQHAG